MSYYDNNPQWTGQPQNNWDSQGSTTPVRAGASGPQPQDEYAFSYQFDEVDRSYENLQKSGKGYGMGGGRRKFSPMHGPGSARRTPDFEGGRMPHGPGPRSHSVNNFEENRGPQGANLHNFYASQRHQSSRGSNEAEQVMQAKRRMAAQRERELRNLHTEQQYQRNVLTDVSSNAATPGPPPPASSNSNKHMSEEETRELIARQRSALYGEGPFADQGGYVDENGSVRTGAPGPSGPPSLRGHSPMTFDGIARAPAGGESGTPGSATDPSALPNDPSPRPASTASPQTGAPTNKVFDNAVGPQSRTNTSSPSAGSPPRDLAPGSKPGQTGATVAPIGTRPSGTPTGSASAKRSTTPGSSGAGWGRGNGVWGQPSGLGTQASVWG